MKQPLMIPALAVGGGGAALALRLAQNRTGFEEATGLAVRGNVPAMALTALCVVLAATFFFLGRHLPKGEVSFPSSFSTKESTLLTLPVMGCFLMMLSGTADLAAGLGIMGSAVFSERFHLVLGVLAVLSALCLLLCASACRSGKWQTAETFNGALLLPVVVTLVLRLVVTYRVCSIDPTTAAYVVEILALLFLSMGFFRLSAFAFGEGKSSSLVFYAAMAVVFSLASIADFGTHIFALSSIALYVGGAAALLGFLLLHLCCEPGKPAKPEEPSA